MSSFGADIDSIQHHRSDAKYLYENDTIKQEFTLEKINIHKIYFELSSFNKKSKLISKISGYATGNNPNDTEIDNDENGEGYLAIKFVYKKECILHFRFDFETYTKLQIIEYGNKCLNFREIKCPFQSQGILIRKMGNINFR